MAARAVRVVSRPRVPVARLVAAALAAGAIAQGAWHPPIDRATAQVARAGLVIQFADGSVRESCVVLGDTARSGEDLLRMSGVPYVVQAAAQGSLVCAIGGYGCPADDCLCACPAPGPDCSYWAYYVLVDGAWAYSSQGASSRMVHDGDVDGWSWGAGTFGSGSQPPVRSFGDLCAAADAGTSTAQPTAYANAPSATPQPTGGANVRPPKQQPTGPPRGTAAPPSQATPKASPSQRRDSGAGAKRAPVGGPVSSPSQSAAAEAGEARSSSTGASAPMPTPQSPPHAREAWRLATVAAASTALEALYATAALGPTSLADSKLLTGGRQAGQGEGTQGHSGGVPVPSPATLTAARRIEVELSGGAVHPDQPSVAGATLSDFAAPGFAALVLVGTIVWLRWKRGA